LGHPGSYAGAEMKRWRAPKAKPGELKVQWGKLPNEFCPDLTFSWGKGCHKADVNLLYYHLTGKRFWPGSYEHDPGLVEELEKRGYDITTLKFTIQKKEKP
jgi:hypothetical protein